MSDSFDFASMFTVWYLLAWYLAASLRLLFGHPPHKPLGRLPYLVLVLFLTFAVYPAAVAAGFIWGFIITIAQGYPVDPEDPLFVVCCAATLGILFGMATAAVAWGRVLDTDRHKAWSYLVLAPFGWLVLLALSKRTPDAFTTTGEQGSAFNSARRHRPF